MSPLYLLCFLLFALLLSPANAQWNFNDTLDSFDCGSLGKIGFPFTTVERQNSGLLAIQGCDDHNQTAMKRVRLNKHNTSKLFQVTKIMWPIFPSISIIDQDLSKLLENKSCNAFSYNVTIPPLSPFGYFYVQNSITAFNCSRKHKPNGTNDFVNYTGYNSSFDIYFAPPSSEEESLRSLKSSCSMVQLPKRQDSQFFKNPFAFLTSEITLTFTYSDDCSQCVLEKQGLCRLDRKGKLYCDMTSYQGKITHQGKRLSWMAKLGLALGVMAAGVVVLLMVLACCLRKKIFSPMSLLFWRENPTNRIIEGFLKQHGRLVTARYTYSEVKKMTNAFRSRLGQGGFGSVYKGKLLDGRVVAVKILCKSEGNGEEFINEVASISRTSHVNIVRLLGFCLEGSKRALVYEFMPNGSLDKFIYEDKYPLQAEHKLDCKILYDIAIGIARGLEYLHRGCNTRILHFDIKPHNILLDDDFCPKISDFGLAQVCPGKESTISIFGARGTAGYIAPEVFSRNFGSVSHKSDVYSYGMMILEMVGRRTNIKVEVAHSSEIYFPHWIYDRLESNQEFGLQIIKNESDDKMVRKMTIVGLWCIQTQPSSRPAISKVVEMLESKVELLQIPPKPFLSSPPTSPTHLSCESETL